MPLFGDVSPDCRPAWLLDMPWSAPALALVPCDDIFGATGWAALWGRGQLRPQSTAQLCQTFEAYPDAGWFRYDDGLLTVFWHADPRGGLPLSASHGHNDVGSFVAFYRGEPIYVDSGRRDYKPAGLGRYAMTARAHNTIVVDEHEPFVLDRRDWFPPAYRKSSVRTSWTQQSAELLFSITHDGYCRFGDGVTVERRFRCRANAVTVEDRIRGEGRHRIDRFLHCAVGLTVEPAAFGEFTVNHASTVSRVRFEHDRVGAVGTAGETAVVCGLADPVPDGWVTSEYGSAFPAPTIISTLEASLPVTTRIIMEFT
jgi:hypothetical protein